MCQSRNARRGPRMRILYLFLAVCTVELSSQSVRTVDVLAQIHKRLAGSAKLAYHRPIVFTGEISRLGPVYQGPCKGAVDEAVDFTISRMLLGNHPDSIVHTGYINCTMQPLPSPPFTLHAKVIVYCEQAPSTVCLPPVELTDHNLHQVESWIAALPPGIQSDAKPAARRGVSCTAGEGSCAPKSQEF